MKGYSLSVLIVLLGILLLLFWLPANRALFSEGELRAAIDIGSGSTNLKVAKVDPKTNKIIVSLFEKSIPVSYEEHLEQSPDQTFDSEVMAQGIQSIQSLKEIANSYQVKKIVAIATAAFRQARNANQFAQEIQKVTGIPVRIINQDEEGILAFRGAMAVTEIPHEHAITWDIGGGSMQLTTLTDEGTYFVEKGKTASILFKNDLIEQVKKQNFHQMITPNPMTPEEISSAIRFADSISQKTDPFIKSKIKNPQTQVLAVGSLFNYSIYPLVKEKVIDKSVLEKAVYNMADKNDEELGGGPYADVALANPVMVLGFMEGLHIDKITVVKVNNADGALTFPPYWMPAASTK